MTVVRHASFLVGCAIGVAVLVACIMAYFMSGKTVAGNWVDGLGRDLHPAPLGVQVFFGKDPLWPGWRWFFIDTVVAIAGVGCASLLVSFGKRRENHRSPRP